MTRKLRFSELLMVTQILGAAENFDEFTAVKVPEACFISLQIHGSRDSRAVINNK